MIGKELLFISRLPSYTLKHTVIRILLVSFTGFLFLFIAASITSGSSFEIIPVQYFRVMLVFVIGTEINVFLDNIAEYFFPIPQKIGIRVSMHLVFCTLFAWAAVVYFENLAGSDNLLQEPIVRLMLVLGGIFVFICWWFPSGCALPRNGLFRKGNWKNFSRQNCSATTIHCRISLTRIFFLTT